MYRSASGWASRSAHGQQMVFSRLSSLLYQQRNRLSVTQPRLASGLPADVLLQTLLDLCSTCLSPLWTSFPWQSETRIAGMAVSWRQFVHPMGFRRSDHHLFSQWCSTPRRPQTECAVRLISLSRTNVYSTGASKARSWQAELDSWN